VNFMPFYLRYVILQPDSDMTSKLVKLNDGAEYTIGRSQKCDITIHDPLVSSTHCKLIINARDNPGAYLCDMNSKNGTRVNRGNDSIKIDVCDSMLDEDEIQHTTQDKTHNLFEKFRLEEDDDIVIGETTFTFLIEPTVFYI